MSESTHRPRPAEPQLLAACVRRVQIARAQLDAARGGAVRRWEEQPLRAELLTALEGYAAAITAAGAPVPYRLRDEIDLYRRLGDRS